MASYQIVAWKGIPASVEARLLRRGDKWLVYDVTIEGVSLINNYRTQFDRIIRSSSYAELVKRLKERKPIAGPQPRAAH